EHTRATTVNVVFVVSACLILGAAGCAAEPAEIDWSSVTPPSRAPVVGPPETMDSAEVAAVESIVALVNGYREVEVSSYADPEPPAIARRDLAGYLADPALSEALETLHNMEEAGIIFEGRPSWEPIVSELRLSETPPTATVLDCVDATNWR